MSFKRFVQPLGGLGGDGVEMGVEKDGGEGGIRARPSEEEKRLIWSGEIKGLNLEGRDGASEASEVVDGGVVVWIGVGGVDSEVVLEAGYGSVGGRMADGGWL